MKPIINAAGPGTRRIVAGSHNGEQTPRSICERNEQVPFNDLQKTVHAALAKLTINPATYISSGVAAGLYLAIAASVQTSLKKCFLDLDRSEIALTKVIMDQAHRQQYEMMVHHLRSACHDLPFPNTVFPQTDKAVVKCLDDDAVAVYHVAGGRSFPGCLTFQKILAVAASKGIPVIVDAAVQYSVLENFWKYTDMGASVTLLDGGKGLRFPCGSALMVGKKGILDAVAGIGMSPGDIGSLTRPSRDEIMGLYLAVKRHVEMSHDVRNAWCEAQVQKIADALADCKQFIVSRTSPNETGASVSLALVKLSDHGRTAEDLQHHLMENAVPIYSSTENSNSVCINPIALRDGETEIIINRLKEFV